MSYIKQEIIIKARRYCDYQERSQQELRDKLYEWGLHKKEVELCIALMIEEGCMNEERFAIAFAGGKFRIKQWGRIKIKLALKQKRVSDYCISKALSELNNKDYIKTIEKLIASQSKKIKEPNILKKNYKVAQYIIGKGFEPDLVWDALRGN